MNRTDVLNIAHSVNMTLKDYGIEFGFDEKENFSCKKDGIPDLIYKKQKEIVDMLEPLLDDDTCSFDHHGYCQTHYGGSQPGVCDVEKARVFVKEFRNKEKAA